MNIVMITDTYPPHVNGAALATERLAQQLVLHGNTVSVIAPSDSFQSQKSILKNITIYRVRSVPVLFEKAQEFRVSPKPLHDKEIKSIIKEINPDIIYINEPLLLGLSAIKIGKQAKIPVVASHHFMPENLIHYLHLPPKIEDMIHRRVWKWYAKLCTNFEVVICPTPIAADLIKKYRSDVRLRIISNGIDLQVFSKKNDGAYLRAQFNLPDKPILLFVGRLDKEKNIDVLIRAAALLKEKYAFHIVVVGQGKEKSSLKKLATNVGISKDITFTGFLPKKDLPNIYTLADVFVMPSIAELQSLVTMEAMASGLPVVGANAVAIPHLVHNGENGFLFEPGDEYSLAEKLSMVLADKKLRNKMSEKSLNIIKEHDIQITVKNVQLAFQDAIKFFSITQKI
jgi:1,2-diacylglycerol 3-alpha-glucosyltransferase